MVQLNGHPLVRKDLSNGKIPAQLWELVHQSSAELGKGKGMPFIFLQLAERPLSLSFCTLMPEETSGSGVGSGF